MQSSLRVRVTGSVIIIRFFEDNLTRDVSSVFSKKRKDSDVLTTIQWNLERKLSAIATLLRRRRRAIQTTIPIGMFW